MTESIQALIDKINQEGIQAAEEKAKEIELQANIKAEEILKKASLKAEEMERDTCEKITKLQEKERMLIKQAGRDFLLELREEINTMLHKLVEKQIQSSLTSENMLKILTSIIQSAALEEKSEIIITLNEDDLKILEAGFLAKLKEEVKKEIVLKPSDVIRGGFVISFDAGKSHFDFSNKELAEYITAFLKPELKEILTV
ncbi:MAG: V-type ATP synthase subunit E family protein [Candidatus Omnitrophota bacterium]|nr:V-type ATP synthase subunit E family protein [Candidatus Omnitrophota bacterium]